MNISNMKNMVVLKNLPSNIVEEAIVVIKENVKMPDKQMADNSKLSGTNCNKEENRDYVLEEAKMVVNNYIEKIEDNKKPTKKANVKRLKVFAFISTTISIIELLLLFF